MQTIAMVAGTRPEVIKLAPLRLELMARGWDVRWISTNQQASLNAQTLAAFDITPDAETPPPAHEGSIGLRLSQTLAGLDAVFARLSPQMVIVQGDTSSTAAGALAAFAGGIRLAHVEAGLRTGDLTAPFPEEGWRRLVAQFADLHFPPTEGAAKNLLDAGVAADRVFVTGNTGVDAILHLAGEAAAGPAPQAAGLRPVMVTLHRRELWSGGQAEAVLGALLTLRDKVRDIEIVVVSHANPALRTRLEAVLGGQDRVRLTDPLDYRAFLNLMRASHLVLSDSGGVQEEAPVLGAPLLIVRESTERPEAVACGCARLVGFDPDRIAAEAARLLQDEDARRAMIRRVSPFGDGRASRRIADILGQVLGRVLGQDLDVTASADKLRA